MNVIFISECSGNALKESRRILDQFAERRGERTWQTTITMAGLDTVKLLLRKSARKNTAISCHWVRSRDHTELMWIVGNSSRFNHSGAVPTNTTKSKFKNFEKENDWNSLEVIYLLTALSALLHDLGKACDAFQTRLLETTSATRNIYRHEWISLCLFKAFAGSDPDDVWLTRLANPSESDRGSWLANLETDLSKIHSQRPFEGMSPLAQAVGWLVVTHHRLPVSKDILSKKLLDDLPNCINHLWNEEIGKPDDIKAIVENEANVRPYWSFKHSLPTDTELWQKRASKIALRLKTAIAKASHGEWLKDPYIMHISRLCLMMADHHYSSLTGEDRVSGQTNYPLFANTKRQWHSGSLTSASNSAALTSSAPAPAFNQQLDEHLLGVEQYSGKTVHIMPALAAELPRLGSHKSLRKRSSLEAFRWQDKAAEVAESIQQKVADQGAFIVNMASTGCGKTMANVKLMYSLNPQKRGFRCSFALGLRTLTKQTGLEYRNKLGLGSDDVAILSGGLDADIVRQKISDYFEIGGSESAESLLDTEGCIIYDGGIVDDPRIGNVFADSRAKKLISAPILACTVDHLVPATESQRGGRQIVPMLRLLSSDLVLDEIDDYDIKDLPAITRLVNWAGMLGSKVLISSATLPPSIVLGLYQSYCDGRKYFNRNRTVNAKEQTNVCCLWVDEFSCFQLDCTDDFTFAEEHKVFVRERLAQLERTHPLRMREIALVSPASRKDKIVAKAFAKAIVDNAITLHQRHSENVPNSPKRASFGLVRMANIDPLVTVAIELYKSELPEDYKLHLCVYHSQHLLITRSAIESILDSALNRKMASSIYQQKPIIQALNSSERTNHIFMVLASPVAEVGRDHDYDWAIIEPSSTRSIIQIAGRVQRHRRKPCLQPNVVILDKNFRALVSDNDDAVCFHRPGFETERCRLRSKSMTQVLGNDLLPYINATPRIYARAVLKQKDSLTDLEHFRLQLTMIGGSAGDFVVGSASPSPSSTAARFIGSAAADIQAHSWWTRPLSKLSGLLQQNQRFRSSSEEQVHLVMQATGTKGELILHELKLDSRSVTTLTTVKKEYQLPVHGLADLPDSVSPWALISLEETLSTLAEEADEELNEYAKRFAWIELPKRSSGGSTSSLGWRYDDWLGFSREPGL